MSQRDSGYTRIPLDAYETPEWCTDALLSHIPMWVRTVWEPACGTGKMVRVIEEAGYDVLATDISGEGSKGKIDFLKTVYPQRRVDAIITNPPYNYATEFIEHALKNASFVAMLLRADFDHAKTRRHLFADSPHFHKKVVLTKRIKWIEGSTGSPSFNHSWFVWNLFGGEAATIHYDYQE